MKKAITITLTLFLMFALSTQAFAIEKRTIDANNLHELGLFEGVGTDIDGNPVYELNRRPNREEAITMLVRLIGREETAKSGKWNIPFTDVSEWAKPYVGYAYENGLTQGVGPTTFGGTEPITATQYITFVLRALEYDSNIDFKWDAAWEFSDEIGLTDGSYTSKNNDSFLRGDVAIVSYRALLCHPKSFPAGIELGDLAVGHCPWRAIAPRSVMLKIGENAEEAWNYDRQAYYSAEQIAYCASSDMPFFAAQASSLFQKASEAWLSAYGYCADYKNISYLKSLLIEMCVADGAFGDLYKPNSSPSDCYKYSATIVDNAIDVLHTYQKAVDEYSRVAHADY